MSELNNTKLVLSWQHHILAGRYRDYNYYTASRETSVFYGYDLDEVFFAVYKSRIVRFWAAAASQSYRLVGALCFVRLWLLGLWLSSRIASLRLKLCQIFYTLLSWLALWVIAGIVSAFFDRFRRPDKPYDTLFGAPDARHGPFSCPENVFLAALTTSSCIVGRG